MNRTAIAIVSIACASILGLPGCNRSPADSTGGGTGASQSAPVAQHASAGDAPVASLAAPIPQKFLPYLASKIVTSQQFDTSGGGSTGIALTLPNGVLTGQFLLAAVPIATAPNGPSAGSAAIVAPSNSRCAGVKNPDTCCTGAGTGTCDWTLEDNAACGNDLQVSVYTKLVQPGEGAQTSYSWNFTAGGKASTFLGEIGMSVFSRTGSKPIAAIAHRCATASQTVTAPSITANADNTLDLLIYSVTGDNSLARPKGYSLIYSHPIGETGPDLSSNVGVIPKAGASSGDQISSAAIAGDNVGFQIGLSPSPE